MYNNHEREENARLDAKTMEKAHQNWVKYCRWLKEFANIVSQFELELDEFFETDGENLLAIHQLSEKLDVIKVEGEKLLYGIFSLRNSDNDLAKILENKDLTKKEKAEKSFCHYFLRKMKFKYDEQSLNESLEFAKQATIFFIEVPQEKYIEIYRKLEKTENFMETVISFNYWNYSLED